MCTRVCIIRVGNCYFFTPELLTEANWLKKEICRLHSELALIVEITNVCERQRQTDQVPQNIRNKGCILSIFLSYHTKLNVIEKS